MRRTLRAGLAGALTLVVVAGLSTATATATADRAPQAVGQGVNTLGSDGWTVVSSAVATQSGKAISTPGLDTSAWLPVHNDDGGAPGTEITALLQNGKCANVFYADNLKQCFGYTGTVGPVTVAQFKNPWWWRTTFTANLASGQHGDLVLNGVVGAADVWLNGQELATKSTVTGAYTRNTFDVSGALKNGANALAIEVYPNDPNSMYTLDDVDWNQIPPDNNTGIQFPVQLDVSGALHDGNAHVNQDNAADLSSSKLTVKTDVTNNTGSSQTGQVSAVITPPSGGGAPITVTRSVTVAAHKTSTVTFNPVTITHPQVWWPYQLGAQPLYTLATSVTQNGKPQGTTSETFGIRTVTSALVGKSAEAPQGVRQYYVNGKPLLIRGGGFAEDLFLRYSSANIASQIALLRNLGVNTLRLEGHQFPDDFYQQMDKAGILIDAGWQCCDNWQPPSDGSGVTAADYATMALSALTVGQDLRNHPSVFTFSWSDNAPIAKQETVSLAAFQQADFTVPIISSAEYNSSPKLGQSGEKEGPYDYVPPSYWYDTSHYDSTDSTRTNVGGSWGFDSEQSAGDTVPTLDSINRFLSPADQANLWQHPDATQYHLNYETGHGGYAFGELYDFDTALSSRYGQWSGLDSYVEEAQVQDYENTRAQFEAFIDHSTNTPTPATGTIYWQVNKGWPTLLWDLYNYDGDQAGSFFGAKEANDPLHVLYAYDTGAVTVDNLGSAAQSGLSVEAKVYDLSGKVLDDQKSSGLNLSGLQVRNSVLTPKAPTSGSQTYFVELLLSQGNKVVDRNVYWLSPKQDAIDWSATMGNPQATMTQYANLSGLQSLAKAKVSVTANTTAAPGPNGADTQTTVTITNTSNTPTVGFFLRADVRRGNADGSVQAGDNQVTSALWSDNDTTLWPGESETLVVSYAAADLHGATPVVSVSGWNVGTVDVAAPRK